MPFIGLFKGRFKVLSRMMPGLMASILVIAAMNLQAWTPLERTITTQMMRWRGSGAWDSRIVMVSIDDRTLEALGQFPISRDYYAELLWYLSEEEASVVVFNLLFSDNVTAGSDLQASITANAQLSAAMAAHGRVVIGHTWGRNGKEIKPIPVLADTAIATGHLRLQMDPDAITRWVDVTVETLPALGIAAIQTYGLEKERINIPPDIRRLRINWPGAARALTTLSLVDVLNGQVPPGFLKDKIVIVGYGATTGQAQLRTPFDRQVPIPGGYMHAAVIDNLLNQNWFRPISRNAVILSLMLFGPLLSGFLYRRESSVQLIVGTALSVGWLLICYISLYFNVVLPVVTPLVAIATIDGVMITLSRLESNAVLQVRSAFLNTMSHEIRTPLNAIVNLSEMLQETPLNERQREFVETLNNSSQTLLAMINDVLDFSKIESGRLMIEDYPVNLVETLESSIEILAPRAAEKKLELVYAITPNTPAVILSDPIRLQQILLNLLSNAVKFTEAGEISVRVQATPISPTATLFSLNRWQLARKKSANSAHQFPPLSQQQRAQSNPPPTLYEIRFAVSDTGIGISSENIHQLFEPFKQGSVATTRKYGGTGLGLSISQRLSQRMGGNLWVKSILGKGSTFYFTVQAQLADTTETLPSRLSVLNGTRLLLIDGNSTRRTRLTWTLQALGIQVVQATSLTIALKHIQAASSTLDGILLDEAAVISQASPKKDSKESLLSKDLKENPKNDSKRGLRDENAGGNSAQEQLEKPLEEDCMATIAKLRDTAHNQQLPVIFLCTLQRRFLLSNPNKDKDPAWQDKNRPRSSQPRPSQPRSFTQGAAWKQASNTTIVWKPIKQASLYQALETIRPIAMTALSRSPLRNLPRAHDSTRRKDTGRCRATLKVLIAEDNLVNQRVAFRLLELMGYRADIVSSGRAVLAALKHQTYDVILMDMRMPDLDGIETTQKIRNMPQHAKTWIIAMTANAVEKDRQRCFAAGMNDYLSKPIKREALEQALQRCCAIAPISRPQG